MIQKYLMIPKCLQIPNVISNGSMDFDTPKVYGDTSITDGLVILMAALFEPSLTTFPK